MPPAGSDDIELHVTPRMSSAEAPLIAAVDREPDDDFETQHAAGQLRREPEATPGLFVWLLTLSACISGLLFGYDTGVISATLVSIGSSLSSRPLSSLDKSIITSSTSFAALFASPAGSLLADRYGRKPVVILADALFIVGAVIQAWSSSIAGMVLGRAVVGAAVGAASFVVPLYIAEAAPAAWRGRLVTTNVLLITLGQVVAYVVGWRFAEYGDESGWRWMVGLGGLPAVVQTLLMLGMPESPRWLVRAGKSTEAKVVVRKVLGKGMEAERAVERLLRGIETEVREEEEETRRLRSRMASSKPRWFDSWTELFAVRRNKRALTIACLLQGLQQLCGFNSLMYFSATIFTLVGFTMPTLTSLTVAVTNFVVTGIAILLIDRIGRRRVLLYSIPFMIMGLLLASYGFSLINTSTAAPSALASGQSERSAALTILSAIMIYVAAYAIGLGNVPWMQSELFALNVRSLGSGLATGTNWLANFVIGLTFLPLMDILSPSWTFVLYAVICGIGYVLVGRLYPETSGLSLEAAGSLLENDNWGVR